MLEEAHQHRHEPCPARPHRQQRKGQLDALQQVERLVEVVEAHAEPAAVESECHRQRRHNGDGPRDGDPRPRRYLAGVSRGQGGRSMVMPLVIVILT